jgi:hypothetical protein
MPFSALSYAWGDIKRPKSITVNGQRTRVTENLYNALSAIRHPKESRVIWVDQICIDQSNVEEKNAQVAAMTLIYKEASQTQVWLGEHKPPRWVEQSTDPDWGGNWAISKANAFPQAAIYWLYRLSEQEYWKRCWIIQEIGMANDVRVYFGTQSIPWREFVKLSKWYQTNYYKANVDNILRLDNLRQSRNADRERFSLSNLLTDFRNSFCSVKLDKIFSLVGMADECRDGCIAIDYSSSLYSVYRDVVSHHQYSSEEHLERCIDMAYVAAVIRQSLQREFTTTTRSLLYLGTQADPNSYTYRWCGDERATECARNENITANAKLMDWGLEASRWLGVISRQRPQLSANWLPMPEESRDIWLPDDELDRTNSPIILRGYITGTVGLVGPSLASFTGDPNVVREWGSATTSYYPQGPEKRKSVGLNDQFVLLLRTLSEAFLRNIVPLSGYHADNPNPRLFLGSGKAMIGLIPANAEVGDLVCQFWNTNTAAVIRKRSDGLYHIIGRAVVIRQLTHPGWDVPRNKAMFRSWSSSSVDLNIDLATLTLLTLDSIELD